LDSRVTAIVVALRIISVSVDLWGEMRQRHPCADCNNIIAAPATMVGMSAPASNPAAPISPAAAPNRENAIRHLGPELAQRGASDGYLDAQREAATKTIREFAEKWMREQGRKLGRPVVVTFTGPDPS
jgi:hypothetical protein